MKNFPRPSVVVSKCLGFDMCRYNGQTISDSFIEKLGRYVDFITVCPEVEIGLGVPRFPIRVVLKNKDNRLIQPKTGYDVTDKMNIFSKTFLEKSCSDIDGFILKERSPSCGIKSVKIYYENGNVARASGMGIFAEQATKHFRYIAFEDEGRLKNYKLREHFLVKIFTLARFRKLKATSSMRDLTNFHAENKFLLMAYSQKEMRVLGKIAANHEQKEIKKVFENYENHLRFALSMPPKRSSQINSLQHIFGFFKDELSHNEKSFFLESLDLYKDERIPFISVLNILRTWALRQSNEYLLNQSIFGPYPRELVELKDSGRQLEL